MPLEPIVRAVGITTPTNPGEGSDLGQRFAECVKSCDASPEEAEAIRLEWERNGGRL